MSRRNSCSEPLGNNDYGEEIEYHLHQRQKLMCQKHTDNEPNFKAFYRTCLRLGDAFRSRGYPKEATLAFREVIDGYLNKYAPFSRNANFEFYNEVHETYRSLVSQAYHGIGLIQEKSDSLLLATKYYEASLEVRGENHITPGSDNFDSNDLDSAETRYHLGCCLKRLKRYEEALSNHLIALQVRVHVIGRDGMLVVQSLQQIGFLYLLMGDTDRASDVLAESIEIGNKRAMKETIETDDDLWCAPAA